MKNVVVVISAHPDDETLGAGGTLLKHKSKGDVLYWIIGTKMTNQKNKYSNDMIESRQKEIKKVSEAFGFSNVFQLDYETTELNSGSLKTLIPEISKIFSTIKPNIIYNVNINDAHSDHQFISKAVFASSKNFRHPYIKKVLMYECLSETEFAPQLPQNVFIPSYFVDISDYIDEKIKIMKVYESELGKHPFPRSIESIKSLSLLRGSIANVKYAEAFQAVKIID